MKKALALSLIALLMSSSSLFAQTGSNAEFVNAFESFIRTTTQKVPDIPGIAIVVIKDDKPIFMRAYGMADKEAGTKADTDTLFYIASSNKAFTALAAAMFDKEGKIKLSDPLVKYTSGIKFKNDLPDKITVRDLLTHTSGLQNSALVHRTAFTGQIDKSDISHVFANGTTFNDANFGTYRYTNLGYNIYSLILENNLKLKWQDVLQKRIFDAAGLKHTTAYISRAGAKKWTVAAPYPFSDEAGGIIRSVLVKKDNNMQAAGGMFMSISDLGRWLNLQMNDGKLDGKQVLPADLIRASHVGYAKSTRNEPPFSGDGDYGLGWQIGKYKAEKVIYHHGGYSGYRSHVSFMPEKKIAVGILVNNDMAGGRVADTLAAYAYDWWMKTENLEADYAKQIDDFVKQYEGRKQQMIGGVAERAKRISQLTGPLTDYVGTYSNDLFGTFEVMVDGQYLAVRMGNMYSRATPFIEKDTIRVILNLQGSGETMKFNKSADGKTESLVFSGQTFSRAVSSKTVTR